LRITIACSRLRQRRTADAEHYAAYLPAGEPGVKISWLSFHLAVFLFVSINVHADSHKQIVGATEVVFIEEANLPFKARVDTGAKTSSIHAENIEVDLSGDPRGKPISFYLVTKEGLSRKIETRVSSVVKVRTSEMVEQRYVVPLLMKWKDSKKTVLVTLNDRTRMGYRLLLGRNWLHGDFIVDVDKNNDD
jgi:hypothetical protein